MLNSFHTERCHHFTPTDTLLPSQLRISQRFANLDGQVTLSGKLLLTRSNFVRHFYSPYLKDHPIRQTPNEKIILEHFTSRPTLISLHAHHLQVYRSSTTCAAIVTTAGSSRAYLTLDRFKQPYDPYPQTLCRSPSSLVWFWLFGIQLCSLMLFIYPRYHLVT